MLNLVIQLDLSTQTAESLNKIVTKIESGKGTAGKLVNDDGLYESLIGTSKELESLLSDLKKHPKRYVHFSLFGKKKRPTLKKKIKYKNVLLTQFHFCINFVLRYFFIQT